MRNLWVLPAERHLTPHPTEKPESLLSRIVQIGSRPNDTVLDPFMGSGTTGVVAKRYHRHFTGIEVDETFFKIAKARIESTQVGIELSTSSGAAHNGNIPLQHDLYSDKAQVEEDG